MIFIPNFKIRKTKIWTGVVIAAVIIVILVMRGGGPAETYEFMTATRGELVQEVSVTGKVRAAQSVDLQFESSGRIALVNYKVGEKVLAGATIVSLENQDLQAAIISAKADLDRTVRNLNSLNDSSISSSLRVDLENAKINLDQVSKKADGDLASKYSIAFNDMREAMTEIDTASVILEYIRKTYLEAKNPWDNNIKQRQADISFRVQDVETAFPMINQPGLVITLALYGQMDLALQKLVGATQSLRDAFAYLQEQLQTNSYLVTSSTDRASINTEATSLASDLSALSSAIRGIADQDILNSKNIADAQAKLSTAQAAFPTYEDVLQKQAALSSAQSQLRKTLIPAPFSGLVAKIDATKGETVTSSKVIASVISDSGYQIEADITEIDISKIKIGDMARLTLDAYGPDVVFEARVSAIDPGETIIEGVTTYKTVLNFVNGDNRLRSNMTANVDIQTNKKDNVISVPQRAVITKNGDKFVRIKNGEIVQEVEVSTGLSGKDGFIEIVNGINEGDQVVTFIND